MQEQRLRRPFPAIALTSRNVAAGVLAGRVSGAARDAPQCRPPASFRRTLGDRHPGFGEARSAALDMGGNLVAEVAVRRRAERGGLCAATQTDGPPTLGNR